MSAFSVKASAELYDIDKCRKVRSQPGQAGIGVIGVGVKTKTRVSQHVPDVALASMPP